MLSGIEKAYYGLNKYIPEGSFPGLIAILRQYNVPIKIVKPRNTKLGDYRRVWEKTGKPLITVNRDLNQFAFLITLVHELAHHIAFVEHGNRIKAHGDEWKAVYRKIAMDHFVGKGILPPDVDIALQTYFTRTFASSCADPNLLRVLSRYDSKVEGEFLLEELPAQSIFDLNGRIFKKGERQRKRFKCLELSTRRLYLVSAVSKVSIVEE